MRMEKIKVIAIRYYGYHQGYKVYVNGKKYPRKFGHFYATPNKEKAVKSALREKKTGKEQTY